MQTILYATVGLPASGKTTAARRHVDELPDTRTRVNRDDLRRMLFGKARGLTHAQEDLVTTAQIAAVRGLLLDDGVDTVVVDDTNLNPVHLERLAALAAECGALFQVWDLRGVDVEECVARDAVRCARGEPYVGEDVIRGMHDRWMVTTGDS
jgi:predicted kinase